MASASQDAEEYVLRDTVDGVLLERSSFTNHEPQDQDEHIHLASLVEKKRLWWRNAVINAIFISSWFLFATVLSVYNKWMFAPERFGFPFPLFVTALHMFVQFALAASIRAIWPKQFRPERNPVRNNYIRKAVPTAVATGLDIGLSNLSLKTITLSFYTMCKSSSLIFVLLFAFILRLETFSFRLVGVISLIFSGVVLMVATETQFVLTGLLLVLSASAFGGLRWGLTQLLLRDKKMGLDNPAATVFWLSPLMGFFLAIFSLVLEGWIRVFTSPFFDGFWTTLNTLPYLVLPGLVAFCMMMSEFYIVQRAGVVPMSIAGIAKEVTTIIISAWFFGDELTPLNITGVAITICGIALFTYHKYQKSIESTVSLDAHGNPVEVDNGVSGDEVGVYVELDQTDHRNISLLRTNSDADTESTYTNRHVLFSAEDEGDEDAEEYDSIRSLKIGWDGESHETETIAGDGNVMDRDSLAGSKVASVL